MVGTAVAPDGEHAARRVAAEVRGALEALGRVLAALAGAGPLEQLAERALAEMRDALGLEVAALYLPVPGPRPSLERYVVSRAGGACLEPRDAVVVDEEAWRLAVHGSPLVFREEAAWLMPNPFEPVAASWLVLPLTSEGRLLGVVLAAASTPIALGHTAATVLTLLGDLLGAGIATARLRQELQRTAIERERMRLAAEVHDGLAQDLSLAMRELALLDSDVPDDVAAASRGRLREAVGSAHRVVRSRLTELGAPSPLGGLVPAVREICARFMHRGLPVQMEAAGEAAVPPETATVVVRVLCEALTNAEKHAAARRVSVRLDIDGRRVRLVVEDDGRGIARGARGRPGDGHLGLMLMHERARAAGGTLAVEPRAEGGTRVALELPLHPEAG